MGEELKSSDIREMLEYEYGLSINTCGSPEHCVEGEVGLSTSFSPEMCNATGVGPGPSRPTCLSPFEVSLGLNELPALSSPVYYIHGSHVPLSEDDNVDSNVFAPPSHMPPSPSPPSDEGDSSDTSESDSGLPLAARVKLPQWIRVIPPEPNGNLENEVRARNCGIRNCPPRNSSPFAYYYLFFTQLIWNMLVRETNVYANRLINSKRNSGDLATKTRLRKWVEITVSVMKHFFALLINMGIDKRNNLVDNWSTKKSLYAPFFPNTMSINRFQIISSMFRITATQPLIQRGRRGYDLWNKVRPLLDNINKQGNEKLFCSISKYFN